MQFQPGLPEDVAGLFPTSQERPDMLILDNLMQESAKSSEITQLLTRGTHHLELFTVMLLQNLYPGGQEEASQNRNYHYTVLFKNPRTDEANCFCTHILLDEPEPVTVLQAKRAELTSA